MRIAFAGCEMDLRRQELRRNGELVRVEPQVFDLLLHLIRNRERVVSKDELFEVIWSGRIVSDAALSSRINAARKALGDDGERQTLIKTVHKRGFRFIGSVAEPEAADTAPDIQPDEAVEGEAVRAPGDVFPRSRKPSIAVVPFRNLSPEPDTEYFSYGLTEDIIRLLARNRWLDVLSRHSAAMFKNRDLTAQEVGAALGVRYLVLGSVMRRDERVRISADLICAETGRQLWSEVYDLGLADILHIQSAMAQQIAAVIEPELARLEREAAIRKPPRNLDAWDCYQRGLWSLWGFTVPSMVEAESMFLRAIALDPGFARAHGGLAYVYVQSAVMGEPDRRPALLEAARRHAQLAVALDDRDCMNLCVLGRVHCFDRDYDEAVALLEQCIALNPSFAQGYYALGFTLIMCGREEEAIAHIERATELSPHDPHLSSFYAMRALAHFSLGDLEAAAGFARKGTRVPNAKHWPFAVEVAALGLLGRIEEAQRAIPDLQARHPGYTTETARSDFFFCTNEELIQRFVAGLRAAGVAGSADAGSPQPGHALARVRP